MSDKFRGIFALLVGVFALYQAYVLYKAGKMNGPFWLELIAGALLLVIGVWRLLRKPKDPTAELLK